MKLEDLNPIDWPVINVELTEGHISMLIKSIRFYLIKNVSYLETPNFSRYMNLEKYLQEFITKKD